MNAEKNPFADRGAASRRASAWRTLGVAITTVLVLAAAFVLWRAFDLQARKLDRIQAELDGVRALAAQGRSEAAELGTQLASSQSSVAELKDGLARSQTLLSEERAKLTSAQVRISELEKEKESTVQKHKGLEDEMRAELESKDVTISQLQGKLTVNILDRILFDSGEAVLKPDGQAVLQKIAGILKQHPTLKVHVIGHTDNVPIRASARSRFAGNWELSTARALAAVRFLAETAGVDPSRMGAVGYGEFRPIGDNTTPEGRGQNRRIAITILADELAGADTVPTVQTNLPALAPPVD